MAASGASRASSSCSNGLPSAKRPLIFALPPPRRKNAAAARPANKSGIRAGARSVTSPWMRRSVTRGVPISRPTACSASSSRAPGSTKVLVPPPSAASRRKKPSFTAVSMPTVNTRASPSSDCSRLSTLDSSPTCPSVSSTTTGARAPLSPRPRSCWSACRMARSSSVPPRDSTDRSHFSPRSIAPSSACWNPPGIRAAGAAPSPSASPGRGSRRKGCPPWGSPTSSLASKRGQGRSNSRFQRGRIARPPAFFDHQTDPRFHRDFAQPQRRHLSSRRRARARFRCQRFDQRLQLRVAAAVEALLDLRQRQIERLQGLDREQLQQVPLCVTRLAPFDAGAVEQPERRVVADGSRVWRRGDAAVGSGAQQAPLAQLARDPVRELIEHHDSIIYRYCNGVKMRWLRRRKLVPDVQRIGALEPSDLLLGQLQRSRAGVLAHVRDARCFRDGEGSRQADQERERHLPPGRVQLGCHCRQLAAFGKIVEGAVPDQQGAKLATCRKDARLHVPLPEIVEDLVADDPPAPGDARRLCEQILVEVADAVAADLAGRLQLLERGDGVLQGVRARPVEQVAVEPVRPQPLQRLLARAHGARAAGVGGDYLGDDEDFVASPFDGLGDHLLGAVQLGGVDVREPELDPGAQGLDRFRAAQPPGTLANDGHPYGTELTFQHARELNPAPRAPLAKGATGCLSLPRKLPVRRQVELLDQKAVLATPEPEPDSGDHEYGADDNAL